MIIEPEAILRKNISTLLLFVSWSLTFKNVAPVCGAWFHVIYPEPGSPLVDTVFA